MWAPNSTSRILNNARSPWTIFIRLVAFFLGEWTGFAQFFIGISRMQCAIYMHRQRVYSGPAPQPLAWHAALQMWPFHLQLQNAIRHATAPCSTTQTEQPCWASRHGLVRTGEPASQTSTRSTPEMGYLKDWISNSQSVDHQTSNRQLLPSVTVGRESEQWIIDWGSCGGMGQCHGLTPLLVGLYFSLYPASCTISKTKDSVIHNLAIKLFNFSAVILTSHWLGRTYQ